MIRDFAAKIQSLLPPNFLELYSLDRLRHLFCYLDALQVRAERGKNDPEKDKKKAEQLSPFLDALRRIEKRLTALPISAKRLALKIKEINGQALSRLKIRNSGYFSMILTGSWPSMSRDSRRSTATSGRSSRRWSSTAPYLLLPHPGILPFVSCQAD
jgi:hypothetical protein